ncbi:hypothetical protein ACJW30_08G034200 [Castanea mollissima]
MDSCKILFFLILRLLFITVPSIQATPAKLKLFREHIGAEFQDVTFSDVPINPNIEFHFILSFVIDYSSSSPPSPTNGDFVVYWDPKNLTPSNVSSIKANHSNVKVALSLGGDTIQGQDVHFEPTSIDYWVTNAIKSITQIVRVYNLDGIDIDYEHFTADPNTFAECIGRLLLNLKQSKVVSFASIAPYDNDSVQPYYLALWQKYGHLIDYVNSQFYAYEKGTTISQFITHFETQNTNYKGGKVLVSFGTDGSRVYLLIMGSLRLVASFNVKANFMAFLFGLLTTPRIPVFVMRSNRKHFWPAQNDSSLMQDQKRKREVMGSSLCGTVANKFISGYCIMAGISIN